MYTRTYLDIITEMNMATLHGEVEDAQSELDAFMKRKPDLYDARTREDYLPIKARYDAAIEALGRETKS